jgi:hypothetical protein
MKSRLADLSNNQTMINAVKKDGNKEIVGQQEYQEMLQKRKRRSVRQKRQGPTPNFFNSSLTTNVVGPRITGECKYLKRLI